MAGHLILNASTARLCLQSDESNVLTDRLSHSTLIYGMIGLSCREMGCKMPPMFRIRVMLLMLMVGLLFACSSTPASRTAGMPRVVCKLVGVDGDVALFENRRFEPDGKLSGVWTNRVSSATLTPDGKTDSSTKSAMNDYVKSLRASAEAGSPEMQYRLGLIYYSGKFVKKDDAEALMWYLRASMQGNAPAQRELGGMYQLGQSAPKDFVEAYKWFELSAQGGEMWSVESRKVLEGYMTKTQVAEAKKRVTAFKPVKESGK